MLDMTFKCTKKAWRFPWDDAVFRHVEPQGISDVMLAVKGVIDARELELCMGELIEAGADDYELAWFVVGWMSFWVRFTFRVFE